MASMNSHLINALRRPGLRSKFLIFKKLLVATLEERITLTFFISFKLSKKGATCSYSTSFGEDEESHRELWIALSFLLVCCVVELVLGELVGGITIDGSRRYFFQRSFGR